MMAQRMTRLCLAALAVLLLGACQALGTVGADVAQENTPSGEDLLVSAPARKPVKAPLPPPEDLWERLRRELSSAGVSPATPRGAPLSPVRRGRPKKTASL